MTRMVTLECQGCEACHAFATEFRKNEEATLEEVQEHMDRFYKARCGSCFDCNWTVLHTSLDDGNRNKLYAV